MLGIDGITADAISLRLTVAVRANAQWAVERELRRRILIAFDENGIRPLYLDGLSSGTVETLEKASR
ncbi:mscS mechanosensitive ion channel domain protein [Mycobacteroides abscessus MAB_082312_2258]|nr:mscS mechanosensitive ion channel domain protein [Mycobacteroides abscessus MAB_082312_2258]